MEKKKNFKVEINFCPSARKVGLESERLATDFRKKTRTNCVIPHYQRKQGEGNLRINTIRNSCLRIVRISPLISSLPVADSKLKMSVLRDSAV
jgi:hypothetical protein